MLTQRQSIAREEKEQVLQKEPCDSVRLKQTMQTRTRSRQYSQMLMYHS